MQEYAGFYHDLLHDVNGRGPSRGREILRVRTARHPDTVARNEEVSAAVRGPARFPGRPCLARSGCF
jgi:hypothetical protein